MARVYFDPARRQFFRGDFADRQRALRLPWSVDEQAFVDGCTRCDSCESACPERIITKDAAGFPHLDFTRGECTFCARCVAICSEPLFNRTDREAWPYRAHLSEHCLTRNGVECRACQDACELEAIQFSPRQGGVAQPEINTALCSGCGACVAPCPVNALTVVNPESMR